MDTALTASRPLTASDTLMSMIHRCAVISLASALAVFVAPAQSPAPQLTSMSALIYGGHSLKGDGLGPYVSGKNDNAVGSRLSLGLLVSSQVEPRSNKPLPDSKGSERYFIFDLTHPVPGSGSTRLDAFIDHRGRFHAFWKHNHETETILNPMDIGPVGTSVDSDRIEMYVSVSGVQHVLQMGPWAMGEFSPRAPINGNGTTKAKITRESEDSWRITAPPNSIARLWDFSDIQRPVDKGLYYFDFDVKFTRLK